MNNASQFMFKENIHIADELFSVLAPHGSKTFTTRARFHRPTILINGFPTANWLSGDWKSLVKNWVRRGSGRIVDIDNSIAIDAGHGRVVVYLMRDMRGSDQDLLEQLLIDNKLVRAGDSASFNDLLSRVVGSRHRDNVALLRKFNEDLIGYNRNYNNALAAIASIKTKAKQCDDIDVFGIISAIGNNQKVRKVGINSQGKLKVTTTDLFIVYETGYHSNYVPIGDFEINIGNCAPDTTVRALRQIVPNGKYHPHVPSHGLPCWGEASNMINQCIDNCMIPELVVIIIQYLENVNINDTAGKSVTMWPHISKEAYEIAISERKNRRRIQLSVDDEELRKQQHITMHFEDRSAPSPAPTTNWY